MKTILVNYAYPQLTEEELEDFLDHLEKQLGGRRAPYAGKAGAIDLVSFLEIALVFTASVVIKTVVQKYFEGLLNTDGIKKLGEERRNQLHEWFVNFKEDVSELLASVRTGLQLLRTPFTFRGSEKAIVLELNLPKCKLLIVLNHSNLTPQLFENLAEGILAAIRFLSEKGAPDDCPSVQLYFASESQSWKYLLIPSRENYGRWIDRYIDLDTGEIKRVASPSDFVDIFQPPSDDEYKFLISPFRGIEGNE